MIDTRLPPLLAAAVMAAAATLHAQTPDATTGRPRALWHWDASRQMADAGARRDFLDFCRRERIDRVWLQISATPPPKVELRHAAALRTFLAAAHAAGIAVEALDGSPENALRENHARSLGLLDAVGAFNAAGRPEERFDGVHLDNEPYLMLGWHATATRREIVEEFVELNAECQRRARAHGFAFGIDIPTWWRWEPFGPQPEGGPPRTLGHHLVELVDHLGLMNYRNVAEGEDGIVEGARFYVEHADKTQGARIWSGIETFLSPPSNVRFVAGRTKAEFEAALAGPLRARARSTRFDGFIVHVFDDGEFVHVGLERPAAASARKGFAAALDRLEAALGAPRGAEDLRARLERGLAALRRDREWSDVALEASGPTNRFHARRHMLPKLTFASRSAAEMAAELAKADAALRGYGRYAGIALHYYDTYRRKVEGR